MNVLLVRPPAGYSTGKKPNIKRGLYLMPQGLIYLAEALIRDGHEVQIVDIEEKRWSLKDVLVGINKFSPHVIGLTTTTPSWPFVKVISKKIRELSNEIKIIMGGPHAMFDHKVILESGLADVVIIGEGEISFPEYINNLQGKRELSGVHGIAYVQNGHLCYTPYSPLIGIDSWGIPAYHMLNVDAYKRVGGVSISAMRGCPFACAFCLIPKIHSKNPLQYKAIGVQPRIKGAKTIFKEMCYLHSKYGIKEFNLVDPIFTYYPKRVAELCAILIREEVDFRWSCQTRVDHVSNKLLAKMAKAGCVGILFGVESSNEQVLLCIDKRTKPEQIINAMNICKRNDIHPTPSLIMGLPGDSSKGAEQNIQFAEWLNNEFGLHNYFQFNTFMPSPGSLIKEDIKKYKLWINPNISYSYYVIVPVTSTPDLPFEKHIELWHKVWETFFPKYYDLYKEAELCALSGEDPLLREFMEDKDEKI